VKYRCIRCKDRPGSGKGVQVGPRIRGVAVHIAARVATGAAGGEVRVPSTVKELITGSGIPLNDAGRHQLKGVPGQWELYRVRTAPPMAPA
jgi:class 3 adenylate cyclase